MKNLINEIQTALEKTKNVNNLSVSKNTITMEANFNYLSNCIVNVNYNDMQMVTDITLNIYTVDKRIEEKIICIYPHEFRNKLELLGLFFSKLTNYNRKIGYKIEMLRRQLNLFVDDNE